MGRSLAIAFICSLGLAAFSAGCSSDDENGGNNAAGTGGAAGDAAQGGTGGASGVGGASATGGASGESGVGGTGGDSGAGGMGVTGGGGGAGGVGGGEGGMNGGEGTTWSHLGYDQTNTYFNPGEKTFTVDNAAMVTKKWEFTLAGVPHGGVSIAEGKAFVTSGGGTYGLDVKTGDMLWMNASVSSEGTAAYHNGFVYVHTVPGFIHKLNAADGVEVWKSEKTYALAGCDGTSSAVVGGDKVLVGHSCGVNEVAFGDPNTAMSKGGVEAFDIETGERAWTYSTVEGQEDGAMVWSTVSVDLEAGVVFAATGNNYTVAGANSDSIHAINLDDGTRKWRTQVRAGDQWSFASMGSEDTDFGANPILATIGDRKVVAAGDKASAFWVLDRETGEIIWQKEDLSASHSPANGGVLNNGAFDGERFYVASNAPPSACVYHALAAADGAAAWAPKNYPKIIWGMSSVANGVLVVPVNTELHLYNAATGDMLTSLTLDGTVAAGAPAIADGMIVVKSGMQYVFGGADSIAANKVYGFGLP